MHLIRDDDFKRRREDSEPANSNRWAAQTRFAVPRCVRSLEDGGPPRCNGNGIMSSECNILRRLRHPLPDPTPQHMTKILLEHAGTCIVIRQSLMRVGRDGTEPNPTTVACSIPVTGSNYKYRASETTQARSRPADPPGTAADPSDDIAQMDAGHDAHLVLCLQVGTHG